jgi:MbtH protein
MTNPFEDDDASYFVLVNDEGQHSLWPETIQVPAGWTVVFGAAARQACVDHVETSWTDMRPRSLARAMDAAES